MDIIEYFGTDTNINIKGTYDNPLFKASDIAAILDLTNVRVSIKDFDDRHKVLETIDTPGGKQEVIFLTEKGLYLLLFRSKKSIAMKFNDWVTDILHELRTKGKVELENKIKIITEQSSKNLGTAYHEKRSVYVMIFLVLPDGKFIIKIGQTSNSQNRDEDLFNKYKIKPIYELLTDCNDNAAFEKHLHNLEYIKQFQYKEPPFKNTREFYAVSKEELEKIKEIIMNDRKLFNGLSIDQQIVLKNAENESMKLQIELEKIRFERKKVEAEIFKNVDYDKYINLERDKLEQEKIKNDIDHKKLILETSKNVNVEDRFNYMENKINSIKIDDKPIVSAKCYTGDKYQIYDPNTLKLIKTFQCMEDVIKFIPDAIPQRIRANAEKNIVYRDYRFKILQRNDPEVEYVLPEATGKASPSFDLIIMMNKEKNNIVKIFTDAKEAATYIKENTQIINPKTKTITNAIKINSFTYGYYWIRMENCNKELLEKYTGVIPEERVKYNAIKIYKFDSKKKLIRDYKSVDETIKNEHFAVKSLHDAIEDTSILHDCYWSYDEKLD